MNRNRAVLLALLAVFVFVLPSPTSAQVLPVAQVSLSPNKIPQFAQALPVLSFDNTGIPVVDGGGLNPANSMVNISVCEFQTQVLPTGTFVPNQAPLTWVWGYRAGANCPPAPLPQGAQPPGSYIGPVIVAKRTLPTEVAYINQLGSASATNVWAYQQATDQTLMWADPLHPSPLNPNSGLAGLSEGNPCKTMKPQPTWCLTDQYPDLIPVAPHLHGGEIPAMLDGGPDAWWTNGTYYGHGYYSRYSADIGTGQASYRYPNGQEAAPIWFHDHTLGATRLNVYAGIAGGYMIIDPNAALPTGLTSLGLLNGAPDANGKPTEEPLIPIVIQDRMFDTTGQLLFPNLGINPTVHPFWIPEFVGDTIVVNGKAWPYHNVEPKRYRFLFLNGSNARTYELFLINKTTGVKGPPMYVIGTDQGYLEKPAKIDPNVKPNNVLVMMPGERYEVIIDFSGFGAGTKLLLSNSAKTPYPAGAPPNGRTVGRIMEFRLTGCTSGFCGATADKSYNPGATNPAQIRSMVRLVDPVAGAKAPGATIQKVRRLTLNEVIGAGGPLEILVNNTPYVGVDHSGAIPVTRADFKPITTQWNTTYYSELPHEGETELWEIVNLTADAHPIHPHLVAFQLMNRQAFDVKGYLGVYNAAYVAANLPPDGAGPPLNYNNSGSTNTSCSTTPPGRGALALGYIPDPLTNVAPCTLGGNPEVRPFLKGLATGPTPSEAGWKDTVMAMPGQVTRILVRFAPTPLPTTRAPDDAYYDFDPNGGHGYVWHCHIIDHEDNEMMRPFSVFTNPKVIPWQRTFIQGTDY